MKRLVQAFGLLSSFVLIAGCTVYTASSPDSAVAYAPEYSGYNVGYGYGSGEGLGGYNGFGNYVGYGGWASTYYGPGYSSSQAYRGVVR